MFNDFKHRQVDCTVNGTVEKVVLSRVIRGQDAVGQQSDYNGLFSPSSTVTTGAKVIATDTYLVLSLRSTTDGDKYCSVVKTNVQITVQRETKTYDADDNPTGKDFPDVVTNVDGFAKFVSGDLTMKREGLLPTTTHTLVIQSSAGIERMDRVVMNTRNYQVDVVDNVKYPNLLFVELSEDIR